MILVVNDDPRFLEEAVEILNRDRQVFLAGDRQRALRLAEDLGFSVALVDLDFEGQKGLDLIRELTQHVPDLPVIAISGVLRPDVLERAKASGAVEVLQKPPVRTWKPVVERIRATAHRAGRQD